MSRIYLYIYIYVCILRPKFSSLRCNIVGVHNFTGRLLLVVGDVNNAVLSACQRLCNFQ